VTPLGDRRRGTRSTLDDDDLLTALDEMRRRRETLGPRADDDDGKLGHDISSDRKISI
jgi:hypothetical protein